MLYCCAFIHPKTLKLCSQTFPSRDAVVSHFDEYVVMFAIKGISELTNVTGTYKSFLAQSAINFSKTYIPFESIANFTPRRKSYASAETGVYRGKEGSGGEDPSAVFR